MTPIETEALVVVGGIMTALATTRDQIHARIGEEIERFRVERRAARESVEADGIAPPPCTCKACAKLKPGHYCSAQHRADAWTVHTFNARTAERAARCAEQAEAEEQLYQRAEAEIIEEESRALAVLDLARLRAARRFWWAERQRRERDATKLEWAYRALDDDDRSPEAREIERAWSRARDAAIEAADVYRLLNAAWGARLLQERDDRMAKLGTPPPRRGCETCGIPVDDEAGLFCGKCRPRGGRDHAHWSGQRCQWDRYFFVAPQYPKLPACSLGCLMALAIDIEEWAGVNWAEVRRVPGPPLTSSGRAALVNRALTARPQPGQDVTIDVEAEPPSTFQVRPALAPVADFRVRLSTREIITWDTIRPALVAAVRAKPQRRTWVHLADVTDRLPLGIESRAVAGLLRAQGFTVERGRDQFRILLTPEQIADLTADMAPGN